MSDGSNDEAESSSPSFESTIKQLSRLLNLAQYDKDTVKTLMNRIVSLGMQIGFSDLQATQVVQLALRGGPSPSRAISNRVAIALLKSIYPANNQVFGDEFVLTIVGALGPAKDAVVDRHTDLSAALNLSDSSASENDEDYHQGHTRLKRRKVIAIGVQAAALRLLVLLMSPPPVVTLAIDENGQEMRKTARLPSQFLTSRALRIIDKCHGIFFHYLDYQTLRPYLCRLLSSTIRRMHVRHHRIVKLISLHNLAPEDTFVSSLLTTCSKYFPDLRLASPSTLVDTTLGEMRYPDSKWILHVNEIWNQPETRGGKEAEMRDFDGHQPRKRRKQSGAVWNPRKFMERKKSSVSPAASLLPAPSFLFIQEGSLLITEVMSYKGLGYAFDRLQLPNHLVSAIVHQMTGIAVLAQGHSGTTNGNVSRICHWAISAISEEINLASSSIITEQDVSPRTASSHHRSAATMLLLGEFAERMGACPVNLQRWTSRLLQPFIWSSMDIEEKVAILKILEYFVPDHWGTFLNRTLAPLLVLANSCQVEEASLFIDALRSLLARWVIGRNWSDISLELKTGKRDIFFGFHVLSPRVEYTETIMSTITLVMELSSSLLIRFPTSLQVMNSSIDLYEAIFTMPFFGLQAYQLPPRYPLHLLCMTQFGSVSTLSRLFGVIKQILDMHNELIDSDEALNESMDMGDQPERIRHLQRSFKGDESKDTFNLCSIFLSDLVWRSNAFGSIQGNVQYDFGLPRLFLERLEERCEQRGDELVRIGSISHGATLGPLMEAHANEIRQLEAKVQGPITAHVLKQMRGKGAPALSYIGFRDVHLDWLAVRHARGFRDFFQKTVSRLLEATNSDRSRDQSAA